MKTQQQVNFIHEQLQYIRTYQSCKANNRFIILFKNVEKCKFSN